MFSFITSNFDNIIRFFFFFFSSLISLLKHYTALYISIFQKKKLEKYIFIYFLSKLKKITKLDN